MMLYTTLATLLFFLNITSATFTCDASNAYTIAQLVSALSQPSSSGSGSESGSSGSSGSGVCIDLSCPYCGMDGADALCQSWRQTQLSTGFNSVVTSGGASFAAAAGARRRSAVRRADAQISCDDQAICLTAAELFMCVDADTLDFTDSNGGSGNLDSDVYTMSNGEATSVASTATGLPTPTGSGGITQSGSTKTGIVAAATASATGTGSAHASSTATGAKPSEVAASGADKGKNVVVSGMLVAVLGAVGLSL